MLIRDAIGNTLQENDPVTFSLGFGQTAVGRITKIDSGIGQINNAPRQVVVFVTFSLPLGADPQGTVGAVVKVAQPETPVVP
jgi:hypothetical protein